MVQRRNSTWPLLWAAACLLVLSIAPPLLWDDFWTSKPNSDSREAVQSPTLATAPRPDLYRFREVDEVVFRSLSQSSDARPEEAESLEPTEAQPVEAADRVASQVVEPDAPAILGEGQIGPRLTANGVPRQASEAPSAAGEVQESKTTKEQPIHTALLPRWVRQLPALVANLRMPSVSELSGNGQSPGEIRYPETSTTPASLPAQKKKPQTAERKTDDSWPEPTALIERLQLLSGDGPERRWAEEVLRHIRALGPAVNGGSDEAAAIVGRLADLERRAHELAANISDEPLARNLRRAGYALGRRIDIWEHVVRAGAPRIGETIPVDRDPRKLARCLAAIESATGDSTEGRAWRKYLMTGAIKEGLALGPSPDEAQLRRLARRVLVRLMQTTLTPEQQDFVSGKAVTALRDELWLWAAEPISTAALLSDVERYERTGLPSDAHRLAMDCQYLLASPAKARRVLAARVDSHYRNANFRLAVTEKLLNDLIPEQNLEYARVNDTVLGHPTRGESLMATEAVLRMRPDPKRVRMELEVTGEIAAITTSDAGRARFHNKSESYYVARKPLEVDLGGISLWPAEVNVYNESRLRGVNTSMDGVPLVGWLFEEVARSQHEQKKPAANREVRGKVAARAKQRIDAEVHEQFAGVVERLNRRVFDPLNSLTLDPQLIEAETTEKRFTMRLRLAGEDQLGSHTPRPRAPSDSLASVQLHETVLNNGIQRLQLAGRTFTLPELADHVAARLSCPPPWNTIPENEDVKITFARKDPVVVRCEDGQIVLTLSIHRLSKSPRRWKEFQIRAFYRPEIDGRSAQLVRDGVIHLIGNRLTVGSQIALRGIFSHVLSKNAPLKLVNNPAVNDRKLEYAEIMQFVINDGWIGIALGPKSSLAGRPRSELHK
ncbi:MAG: hypothetical protein KKA28_11440 [Planctomycetes bacterium]|nr:hypothetical protein [Planctomycetota bacterium]MCG2684401.1 hypothetical protein [Planctomycetales bacterium]